MWLQGLYEWQQSGSLCGCSAFLRGNRLILHVAAGPSPVAAGWLCKGLQGLYSWHRLLTVVKRWSWAMMRELVTAVVASVEGPQRKAYGAHCGGYNKLLGCWVLSRGPD